MSVTSEIARIKNNIAAVYDEAEAKGATIPATENSANLADTVASIPTGTAPILITKRITENGTYTAAQDGADGYSEVTVDVPDESKEVLNAILDGSITEIENDVESLSLYKFYESDNLASASFPNATIVGKGCFQVCNKLSNLYFPKVTRINAYGFAASVSIRYVDDTQFPSLTSIDAYAFANCNNISRVELSNLVNLGSGGFYYIPKLKFVRLPSVLTIKSQAFAYSDNLNSIVIGKRATLENSNAIPAQAIVYVENSDLEWYSTATNWSAIYTEGRIKSIDELPPEEVE